MQRWRAVGLGAVAVLVASCDPSSSTPPATQSEPKSTPTTSTIAAAVTSIAPMTIPASTAVASAPLTTSTAAVPQLEPGRCPLHVAQSVACGTVEVPADRSDPSSGTIVLPVAIASATGPNPRHLAVVIPSGGPGDPGLDSITFFADTPMRDTHDIVTYDQRGVGRAVPSLDCPERDATVIEILQQAGSPASERQMVVDAMQRCRVQLEAAGIDLDDYDTAASATDLDDIRRALGYEQWTILGISYGGRLALETMRSYPDGIRSVILDSVYDVTSGGLAAVLSAAQRGLDQLAAGCAASPQCTTSHGDLRQRFAEVRERYNASPWRGDVSTNDTAPPTSFVITGDDIVAGIFLAAYDDSLVPLLPSAIASLAAGDTAFVSELIREGMPDNLAQADAMFASVDCADNAGLSAGEADRAALAEPGELSTVTVLNGPLCDEWPVEPAAPGFNDPVVSDIPALVFAGSYDPITPPAGTRAVAERLPNATFVEHPAESHAVMPLGDCESAIAEAFLADPTAPLDTSCIDALSAPSFL